MTFQESQDREKRLVQMASETVDMFMQAWYDLKTHPSWNASMCATSDQHVALGVLVARQIRFLDGARGAALVGSPEAVTVLNRCMFETWLSVLAIAFVRTLEWTPEALGTRFMAHNDFLLKDRAHDMRKHILAMAADREINRTAALKVLREIKARKRLPVGTFKKTTDPWYPFKENGRHSLVALSNALWPPNRGRRFPRRLFPLNRREWRKQLNLYWASQSDTVHTTGYVAGRYMRPDPTGIIHDERTFEAASLLSAIDFAGRSIQAVSLVAGMEREWDMTSLRSHRRLEHIQTRLFPYLLIEEASNRVQA